MPVPNQKQNVYNLFTKKTYPRFHYQLYITYRVIKRDKREDKKWYISCICEIWRNKRGKIIAFKPINGFVSTGKYSAINNMQKALVDVNTYETKVVSPDSKYGKLIMEIHADYHSGKSETEIRINE